MRGLELEVIWMDLNLGLIEIQIAAGNGRFAGVGECYLTPDDFSRIAAQLRGFPSAADDRRELDVDGVRLTFRCVDQLGHAVVDVRIEADDETVSFRFPTDPASIDDFVGELDRVQPVLGATACLRQAS